MRTSHTKPFAQALTATQKQFPNATYNWCYGQTARTHKDLFLSARIEGASHQAGRLTALAKAGFPEFANSAEYVAASSAIPKAQQAEMFCMNGCTDDAEMQAAFKGNNFKWSPVNWNDVFAALVKFHASANKNVATHEAGSLLDSIHKLRALYPNLYAQVNGWNISPQAVADAPKVEVANSAPTPYSAVPPHMAAVMKITGCNAQEFDCAFQANGGKTSPLDHNKVTQALAHFYQKQDKLAYTGGFNKALTKFPNLAACFQRPQIETRGIQK